RPRRRSARSRRPRARGACACTTSRRRGSPSTCGTTGGREAPMTATDSITLTGLRAMGYHGVLPHERVEGQLFVVDVVLHLPLGPAAAGDDLGATVDYGVLANR